MKNFDQWNEKKKLLSEREPRLYFRGGKVWWCSIGLNLGSESLGKGNDFRRPVLILKKLSGDACIVLPITSKEKTGSWFVDFILSNKRRWVMLHQIRMIHIKRFQHRMGIINVEEFTKIKEKLESLLELS